MFEVRAYVGNVFALEGSKHETVSKVVLLGAWFFFLIGTPRQDTKGCEGVGEERGTRDTLSNENGFCCVQYLLARG